MLGGQRMELSETGTPAINGVPLDRMMLALTDSGIEIGQSELELETQAIPGRDGVVDTSLTGPEGAAYTDNRDITLHLYTCGDEDDIMVAKTRLGALHGTIVTVGWRMLPGVYRGRLSVGQWDDLWSARGLCAATVDVTVSASPCLLGRVHTVQLNRGSQSIRVDGNRPAWPIWTLKAEPGCRSMTVASGGSVITVNTGDLASSGQAVIVTDPVERKVTMGGVRHPVTLDSDFFPLSPGLTRITLWGCAGSMAYRPRTII